jgi:hypothetical protein
MLNKYQQGWKEIAKKNLTILHKIHNLLGKEITEAQEDYNEELKKEN